MNYNNLEDWCRENSYYPKEIVIGEDIGGEKCSKSGNYEVDMKISENYIEKPKLFIRTNNQSTEVSV